MKRLIAIAGAMIIARSAPAQSVAAHFRTRADQDLLTALVAAEDSRDPVLEAGDARRAGLVSKNPYLRAFTVRGLGRIEDPSILPTIIPLLADPSPEVRIAAADAVAQAVARALPATADASARGGSLANAAVARAALIPALNAERNAAVRAMLLESIGRLNQGSVDQVKATAAIVAPSLSATGLEEREGAIRGIFFLARKREARSAGAIPTEVTDRLFEMLEEPISSGYTPTDRYNIGLILGWAVAMNDSRIDAMIADRDPFVRDRAVAALGRATDTSLVRSVLRRAFVDPAPVVRFRSVTAYAQRLRAADGCAPIIALARDTNMNVAITAADALSGCRGDSATTAAFADSVAATYSRGVGSWHLAAHALAALAVLDSTRAHQRLPAFESSDNFFVRMYADTAARLMRDTAALYRLARDSHPNVRSAALSALSSIVGHAADSLYIAALGSTDNQLLMAASAGLKGSQSPGVQDSVIAAWRRLRASRAETVRDGEDALRELMPTLGMSIDTSRAVKRQQKPLPTYDDLAIIERTIATIDMVDGSMIQMRFHPFDAPTNAARFIRLVKAGTFDGLTFHRVAPFFVVQGPSPNANEYSAPDAPFARDELGVSNVRGTVGLSTRGRDTGDGQIYINTVDNTWLDHEYTVMATITSGLDAFDRMQEGAAIRQITIAVGPPERR